jgi:hypothetical protein
VFGNEKIAFLTYDDEHHRIALIGSEDLVDRARSPSVGFYHAAFTYEGLPQLLQNYVRLKAVGIIPYRTMVHGPTVSMYYPTWTAMRSSCRSMCFPPRTRRPNG